jgi:predicted DNA-binding protein
MTSVDVREPNAKTAKGKSVSARFPQELYEGLEAIATSTRRSIGAAFEAAFQYYMVHYVESEDYLRRVERYQQIYDQSLAQADEARARGKAYRWSPPRAPESGQVPGVRAPGVKATVVRVSGETHEDMHLASQALGVSINDIMIEAVRLWVARHPSEEAFRQRAREAVRHLADALDRCGHLDLLSDYGKSGPSPSTS